MRPLCFFYLKLLFTFSLVLVPLKFLFSWRRRLLLFQLKNTKKLCSTNSFILFSEAHFYACTKKRNKREKSLVLVQLIVIHNAWYWQFILSRCVLSTFFGADFFFAPLAYVLLVPIFTKNTSTVSRFERKREANRRRKNTNRWNKRRRGQGLGTKNKIHINT